MAHIWQDRVQETSTTTGTGAFTLIGAVAGFRTFASVCSTNDTVYYYIEAINTGGIPTGAWETGLGTYSGTNTLTRTTVTASSNAGAAVNFAAGSKRVALSLTATAYKAKGALFDYSADVGNGTTVETDLYSSSIAANTLFTNNDKLTAFYGGTFVSSGTATRQIKLYFGGTAIFDTGALTLSLSSAWTMYVEIIRVSATVIRYMVSLTTQGASSAAYTACGELTGLTLSNTNTMKITGTAAGVGAASNDIVAKMGSINRIPAA